MYQLRAAMSRLVIGIGTEGHGDDAAGIRVLELLDPSQARLASNGEPASLVQAWRDRDDVVLVDAVHAELPPGALLVLDLHRHVLPQVWTISTHHGGAAEAVELARALGEMPPRLLLIGISGTRFGAGESMSPEVSACLPDVARLATLL
jgi:hydrogenase maturation protease